MEIIGLLTPIMFGDKYRVRLRRIGLQSLLPLTDHSKAQEYPSPTFSLGTPYFNQPFSSHFNTTAVTSIFVAALCVLKTLTLAAKKQH